MESIKVIFDPNGGTLTVWFGDPETEDHAEETGDELILMKDKSGKVIGFEKLNIKAGDLKTIPIETITLPTQAA